MKDLKTLGKSFLGIVVGICVQWLSFVFFASFPQILQLDPLFTRVSYTSIGVIVFFTIITFVLRKNRSLAIGIMIGTLLWYPLFLELLTLGGA
jgi:hypothetical protein